MRIDRERLIAHCLPVRKTGRKAGSKSTRRWPRTTASPRGTRCTFASQEREIEVAFFGRFTGDGRMREAHLLTRSAQAPG
ncbi:hypothetical protein [Amycolatopsis rubida]|uniref:hypothetical protein n=1 Tax=Amycolatopsis rubida TaxID=112413 RepID=UPI000B233408|nr:hypothetical protein [Amycolatopsis rubida]